MLKIWDLLTVIKDVKPLFMVFRGKDFVNLYTFEELATTNDVNQWLVHKIRTQYGDGRTTYIIDCEV